jgi:hypothetical protein
MALSKNLCSTHCAHCCVYPKPTIDHLPITADTNAHTTTSTSSSSCNISDSNDSNDAANGVPDYLWRKKRKIVEASNMHMLR